MSENNNKLVISDAWKSAYPVELRALEEARVRDRRELSGTTPEAPEVGFALSGGGIRSATFCLGIFQALAKANLLPKIDYLSTVSGGGYFGGFFGRMYSRAGSNHSVVKAWLTPDGPSPTRSEAAPLNASPPLSAQPVNWLKENGEYMTPGGGGDMLQLVAIAARNAVTFHLVIACFVLTALLAMKLVLGAIASLPSLQPWLIESWSLGLWLAHYLGKDVGMVPSPLLDVLPVIAVLLLPPGWAYWLIERKRQDSVNPLRGFLWTLFVAILVLLLSCSSIPCLPSISRGLQWALLVLVVGFIVILILTACAFRSACAELHAHQLRRAAPSGATDRGKPPGVHQWLRWWWPPDWMLKHPDRDSNFVLSRTRSIVTDWLTLMVEVLVTVAILGLVDTLGLTLFVHIEVEGTFPTKWLAAAGAALAIRFGPAQRLLGRITGDGDSWLKLPTAMVVGLLALLAWITVLVLTSALANAIVHDFALPQAVITSFPKQAVIVLALLAGFSVLLGRTWIFVNRSSHAQLYASRLARAFLGASNPERFGKHKPSSITDPLPDDDANMLEYHQGIAKAGGPLHFINVTINQTTGVDNKTVIRDRKGIGMSVGPCSLSAGIRNHAQLVPPESNVPLWHVGIKPIRKPGSYSMFADHDSSDAGVEAAVAAEQASNTGDAAERTIEVERLTLSQWIGTSGAAFSTAMGNRTALGMSLLSSFINIRLGYWWDSGRQVTGSIHRTLRERLPVPAHLFDEITARFHGPDAKYWYLTDGGHFENMGAYELIRRRLPMIVVIDGEEDGQYSFEGFANLVRKARLDFGAEIDMLDDQALKQLLAPSLLTLFGPLSSMKLAADGTSFSTCRASLAQVRYEGREQAESLLIYIKATVLPGDPPDIHEYRAKNPSFPQQSTGDQFFDEVQWESYRKLGEVIGTQVFANVDAADGRFVPRSLWPVFIDNKGGTNKTRSWQFQPSADIPDTSS